MYLIETEIFYDENNGVLWNKLSETERTHLPLTASHILHLLLENQGRIMSKTHIQNEIWDTYGTEASNNTLNQYISLIRKKFEQLGLDNELVKTVPRAGFLIPQEVVVEHIEFLPEKTLKKRSIVRYTPLLYLFVACAVFLFTAVYLTYDTYVGGDSDLFKIGDIDTCDVFMLYKSSQETTDIKMRVAKNLINKYAPCIGNAIYIFNPSDSLIFDNVGTVFLSRCTFQNNNSGKISGCYDVYQYSEK